MPLSRWLLGTGITILALAGVPRAAAGAPVTIMTGLAVGALQSLR